MSSSSEASIPVAIVGAGPVGLSLALGLARHGVRSILFERKPGTSIYSKAPGIHVRTREIFRRWRIEERFLAAGVLIQQLRQHNAVPGRPPLSSFDFTELDNETDRPGLLILEQGETERLLLDALRESGLCDARFGAEVTGLALDGDLPRLTITDGDTTRSARAEFVAGCDGASSFVRQALGLPFEGITYSLRPMLADVRVSDDRDALPWPRFTNLSAGLAFTVRLRPGLWRLIHVERRSPVDPEEVPAEEVSELAAQLLGKGPVEIVWASRFRIHLRSSPRFRVGRVLLAGDAAHVHSPVGGLGMNTGIQDADNLSWKLAYALRGGDVDRLLDSYDVERRSIFERNVSRFTDLLTRGFIQTPATVREAAFALFRTALAIPYARKRVLRRLTMIDLDYPPSPLLDARERSAGVRLPNPMLRSSGGTHIRLYDLLPVGPAILDVAEEREFTPNLPVETVIRVGPRGYHDQSGLLRRLLGGRDGWIMVRPDAHVAWARNRLEGLGTAVRRALGSSG